MAIDATSVARQLLEEHGLSTSLTDGVISAGSLELSASVFERPTQGADSLLQLDINVRSPLLGNRTLIESFAGWGSDNDGALKQALEKFMRSSLHVFLEVFAGPGRGGDQIEWETWKHGAKNWKVCLGPLFVMGFGQDPPKLQCGELLDQLRDRLLPALAAQHHWLRFYYMAMDGARAGSECLLDNAAWAEGQTMVDESKWPGGSYSVRNFLILVPGEHP